MVMQCAQLRREHTAQLTVMQAAYASGMKISSPRHLRRRENLLLLIGEFGATGLAALSGTPKSHISALASGARGIGDELAGKFERVAERAKGWMDADNSPSESPKPEAGEQPAVAREASPQASPHSIQIGPVDLGEVAEIASTEELMHIKQLVDQAQMVLVKIRSRLPPDRFFQAMQAAEDTANPKKHSD